MWGWVSPCLFKARSPLWTREMAGPAAYDTRTPPVEGGAASFSAWAGEWAGKELFDHRSNTTSTLIDTLTGRPSYKPGLYLHWRTALIAGTIIQSSSDKGQFRTVTAGSTRPSSLTTISNEPFAGAGPLTETPVGNFGRTAFSKTGSVRPGPPALQVA